MNKKLFYIIVGIFIFSILVIGSWLVIETGIVVSSRATFCGLCHSMKPMVLSYRDNTHGGNNPRGITAACTDCHVSHENLVEHFIGKAQSGTHDVIMTVFTDEMNLDWQAKRSERTNYVYDSGCLTCHQELETATADKGYHTNYFAGVTDTQCVECHEEIGHSNLNMYLLQNRIRYSK